VAEPFSQFLTPGQLGYQKYDPYPPNNEGDPGKARHCWPRAATNGLTLKAMYEAVNQNGANGAQLATALKEDLAKAGVTLDLIPLSEANYDDFGMIQVGLGSEPVGCTPAGRATDSARSLGGPDSDGVADRRRQRRHLLPGSGPEQAGSRSGSPTIPARHGPRPTTWRPTRCPGCRSSRSRRS
jgi:ABC-type transport system substrate-binding protein